MTKLKFHTLVINEITLINVILIILFRSTDWISTYYGLKGQDNLDNELNILVRALNIDGKLQFFFLELTGLISIIFNYIYSIFFEEKVRFLTVNFNRYLLVFFNFKKGKYFFLSLFNRLFILMGQITPKFVFFSSTLFIINNIFVIMANNDKNYYNLYFEIDSYISIENIIYFFPLLLFFTLMYRQLHKNFLNNRLK